MQFSAYNSHNSFSAPFSQSLMACLEMYNKTSLPPHSQAPPPPTMSPRISFSNDFVESHNNNNNNNNSQHLLNSSRSDVAPASSDFEFSVTNNYTMLTSTATADELFFKGRLLPFKDTNNGSPLMQRTLRDELLVDDDDDLHHRPHPHLGFSLKPPKSSSSNRWKGFLGLRKSHIGSKKPEKTDSSFDSAKRFSFALEDPNLTKTPQDMVSTEGQSSSDMEMGI